MYINKTSFSLAVFLVIELSFLCHANFAVANNTSYITLSNQIVRQQQLETIANNAANIGTIGFEQDDLVIRKVDYKQNSKRKNSFVFAETNYKSGEQGAIRITNKPTDVAISGKGYLKVLTPRGPRYTLDGAMTISSQDILVNSAGFPYSNQEGVPIELPEGFQSLEVAQDGAIFIDGDQIDIIGVFDFPPDKDTLVKEGGNLYKSTAQEILLEDYTIISGALRESNVNSTLAMARMVEMQRSVGATNNLMSEVTEMEKAAINKLSTK